jgi:L-aminopeptidase/D-esterase-like protein
MRRTFIVIALAAALALPAAAGAANTATLRLNDGFAVRGTSIVCAVQISKSLLPGAKLVDCFVATRKGAVPKSYTVALAVNGEVALGRVGSGGKVTIVLKKGGTGTVAKQSPSNAQGRLYNASVGSTFLVKGTAITCGVSRQTFAGKSAITVACFKVNSSKKPRPGSYGIGITDGGAFVAHFDSKSKGSPVKIVQHGK